MWRVRGAAAERWLLSVVVCRGGRGWRPSARLETVHLNPLVGADGLYVPGEALATLKHLNFLQYGPPDRVNAEEPGYESLLAPYAYQLADALVLVHDVECGPPNLPADSVERMVVDYADDNAVREVGSKLPEQLARLAKWIPTALHLKEVALPGAWHPTDDLDGLYERGVQLAFNSVINACFALRIHVAFHYIEGVRPRGASAAPLCDELRTGLSSEPEIVRLDEPLDEWPGSWALLLADDANDEPWRPCDAYGDELDVDKCWSEDDCW